MGEILASVATVASSFGWVFMKKDKELPWATRLARWGLILLGLAYGVLLVIEKAKEVFS